MFGRRYLSLHVDVDGCRRSGSSPGAPRRPDYAFLLPVTGGAAAGTPAGSADKAPERAGD